MAQKAQSSSSTLSTPISATSTANVSFSSTFTPASNTASWQVPAHWSMLPQTAALAKRMNKLRQRTEDEQALQARISARVDERLKADHAAVLSPDVDSPFVDALDVVKRLLPYHVFQLPAEDNKGKRKATEEDEIRETKFAIECHARRHRLEQQYREIRTKSAAREVPDEQAVFLAQTVLDSDRGDTAMLNAEMRALRTEADRLDREHKNAAVAAATRASFTATPTTSAVAPTAATTALFGGRPGYYHGYPNYPSFGTSSVSSFSVPLAGSAASTSATASSAGTTSTSPPTSTTSSVTPISVIPATTTAQQTPATGTVQQAFQTLIDRGPVPVQLPVALMDVLRRYELIPVAPTTPQTGPNRHMVVLRSTDGRMMNLEIDVGQLKPSQMQGLALIMSMAKSIVSQQTAAAASAGGGKGSAC
ncbi:hypothetical protein CYLTODRAFT_485824 [Cylindrobasidium torrendii FP15055 ss-10]|uniref:GLTSCR protein conserved domain-containing protein n=1 Tax=Cylindrobasidium torrendii FP15055 ss-10 TaxID=1314674 RepID=A0A0D7BU13_9AGAR|nr:hypothetical protein CYLTODRAFT_485824 [Cylindrobasidium torrendii FP15055 ss-10]